MTLNGKYKINMNQFIPSLPFKNRPFLSPHSYKKCSFLLKFAEQRECKGNGKELLFFPIVKWSLDKKKTSRKLWSLFFDINIKLFSQKNEDHHHISNGLWKHLFVLSKFWHHLQREIVLPCHNPRLNKPYKYTRFSRYLYQLI